MGYLDKLKILPFDDSENVQMGKPSGPAFVAQFNPETLSFTTEFEYAQDNPPAGDDGKEAQFDHIKPSQFSFDFLIDGTGASGERVDVAQRIEEFKKTVGFYGAIHRPRFLMLSWGTFIANCVLENYTLNYKLFRPDGTPLRVVITANFKEHKPKAQQELEKNNSSPDVTHSHEVANREHLWWISNKEYKNPNYYLQVAEKNNLDNLRSLKLGSRLYLYPISE